jgi:hypothetical protein
MGKSMMAFVALFTVLTAGGLIAVAENREATMDAIYVPVGRLVLAPPVGVTPKRSAVAFPHSRHFGYTCKTCHHKWNGNSAVQSCTASRCHDQLSASVNTNKMLRYRPESIGYYKYAFHKKCIGCHKEIKAHNAKLERSRATLREPLQATGPTGCVECHPRE